MLQSDYLKILLQGREVWNKWLNENQHIEPDLSKANLSGLDLSNFDLHDVNFYMAHLIGTNLFNANLSGANLVKTNLSNANLTGVSMIDAIVRGGNLTSVELIGASCIRADFTKADIRNSYIGEVDFWEANLTGVNFYESNINYSIFWDTILDQTVFNEVKSGYCLFRDLDLSQAKGLKNIHHYAPSTIGADTLQRSKGNLPREFLRGCGLTDMQIEFSKLYNPGLDPNEVTDTLYQLHEIYCGVGIQYYSAFISYQSNDEVFAKKLHDDLQNNGVRCWFAPDDMRIGDRIRKTIDQQIRFREKIIVILSAHSIKSEWVGDEVEAALEEEKESERVILLPLRIDDAVFISRDDWAAKIKRRRHIGDFSNWKNEKKYKESFLLLLDVLKAKND